MNTLVLTACAAAALGLLVWSVDAAEEPQAGAIAARDAASAEDPYAALPKALVPVVQEMEAQCRAAEGTPAWAAKDLFTVVDFSRDGQPDYLLDSHGMRCDDGGDIPWMGSDGFRYVLFVSTGFGRWTRAFDRRARDIDILVVGGEPRLWLFSHVAYCTKPNPMRYQRCEQVYAWGGKGKLRKVSEDWFTGK